MDLEYQVLKAKLEQIEVGKCRRAILRARAKAQYVGEGERSTAFFFGLEKQKHTKQHIDKLVSSSTGKTLIDPEDILEEAELFYANLFDCQGILHNSAETTTAALDTKLEKADVDLCDAPLSIGELSTAIKGLCNT